MRTQINIKNELLAKPVWIRATQLRARWGGIPNSTFYDRLKKGLIPAPEYPFGPTTPHWRMETIEAFENRSTEKANQAPRLQKVV